MIADMGDSMLDMYMFEATGLQEQLDNILLKTEKSDHFEMDDVNEIFRIMHTIKGSSAMMSFDEVSHLAHAVEDLFYLIRNDPNISVDKDILFSHVFAATDAIKAETDKLSDETYTAGEYPDILKSIRDYATMLKTGEAPAATETTAPEASGEVDSGTAGLTSVCVHFEDDIQMENLRALLLVNNIVDHCEHLEYIPNDIETNPESAKVIVENGFIVKFKSYSTVQQVCDAIATALNVKSYEILDEAAAPEPEIVIEEVKPVEEKKATPAPAPVEEKKIAPTNADLNNAIAATKGGAKTNLISVNLTKLDELQEIVGEIVITESMVTSNPDLRGLNLDNFQKSARQLRKLTDELQDIVLSIRMVPLSGVFNKMHRIVRDMSKKLGKDADLVLDGEHTEVDKSIIDNLADPLMHLVRNSMDHGLESNDEREAAGKERMGTVTLSAQSTAGEVIITISDNGKGLDPAAILKKAEDNGILTKPKHEYTDKEAYNLIMTPGFSTKEQVTEFSGRGVGTDVVKKNIEKIGGSVSVDSLKGVGTSTIIKIPLTLAIVDGMEISVGSSVFTLPINSIKESFNVQPEQLIHDTEGSEMVMVRGEVYPIIRLHQIYDLETEITDLTEGIVILVESKEKNACLFADKLIGEQQVVVKPFPSFMNSFRIKDHGLAGCTILGDGSISLILDAHNIISTF